MVSDKRRPCPNPHHLQSVSRSRGERAPRPSAVPCATAKVRDFSMAPSRPGAAAGNASVGRCISRLERFPGVIDPYLPLQRIGNLRLLASIGGGGWKN